MKGRTNTAAAFVVCLVLALVALPGPSAWAASGSGQFSRAEASADWTQGSVAGSVDWSSCAGIVPPRPGPGPFGSGPAPSCWSEAFVTIGPGSDPAECSEANRRWPHSDEHLVVAWESGERAFGGSGSFDATGVSISGVPGQLACLSVVEYVKERPECSPGPGFVCPAFIAVVPHYTVLASALLAPPAPREVSAPTLTGIPAVGETLTCSNGTWDGAPTSFAYTWFRDAAPIVGASGSTYPVEDADRGHSISCEVTAANGAGSDSAVSNSLSVPSLSPPSIASESVSAITVTGATLEATINPGGFATHYRFRLAYGCGFGHEVCPQYCISGQPCPGPWNSVITVPLPGADLPSLVRRAAGQPRPEPDRSDSAALQVPLQRRSDEPRRNRRRT